MTQKYRVIHTRNAQLDEQTHDEQADDEQTHPTVP